MNDDVGIGEAERARTSVNDGLDRLMSVGADHVFAEPVRVGDRVVIPAAAVEFSGGFGLDTNQASSVGAGGRKVGRPVAVIEAGPEGVRIRPVIDYTRIGLTILTVGFAVWRLSRARRR